MKGFAGRRRGADRRAGEHESHGGGGVAEVEDRGRDGAEDQPGEGGVPPGRQARLDPLLPHRRDERRQRHVPDVASPVPAALRAVHVKVTTRKINHRLKVAFFQATSELKTVMIKHLMFNLSLMN